MKMIRNEVERLTYAIYARKSSEQEDKQTASIDAQTKELRELAEREGIKTKLVLEESYSAKDPGRPVFNHLVELINKGDISGLLVWHPNRLSRNNFDMATITELLQTGKLKSIKTPSLTFGNSPMEQFMFLLAIGQAKLENDNKGVDVKRGLRAKVDAGIFPSKAPLGYTNDKHAERGNKLIYPDPVKFEQIRKLFDLMLTGNNTPPQILQIANEKLGIRTRSGKKLVRSGLYHIFHNPFYYGRFEYPLGSGNWYDGIHKPMITKLEYDRIQSLFKNNRQPISKKKELGLFVYRGLIRCGECGAMITAEEKFKRPKNGKVHHYVYYHCTKRVDPNCQQKSIREEELEELLLCGLKEIQIPNQLHIWVIKELKKMHAQEIRERGAQQGARRRQYDSSVQKLDNLIKMRANGELSEDEFKSSKESAAAEKATFKRLLDDVDNRINDWIQIAEKCFDFASKAKHALETGTSEAKSNIISALGSNLTLKDKKLSIHWAIPFDKIKEMKDEENCISDRLEPQKSLVPQELIEEMYTSSSKMLAVWYQVSNKITT